MRLARTIRFDDTDTRVFEQAAEAGEWAVSGAFEFSNWTALDLEGKQRQAFVNGWLSLESFGRATFVAVAPLLQEEFDTLAMRLAARFVERYGAPDLEAALPVARDELEFMTGLCEEHDTNTLLVVERSFGEQGVHETFRVIEPSETTILDLVPDHGFGDGTPPQDS